MRVYQSAADPSRLLIVTPAGAVHVQAQGDVPVVLCRWDGPGAVRGVEEFVGDPEWGWEEVADAPHVA